ncbi:hypothetical protein D3C80_1826190 [compost metagenome]
MLGHGENTQFVNGTKTVFVAAQCTETRVRIAVEQHGAVDAVFEHFRPGQRTVFGHMPYHHNCHAARFSETGKIGRGFTHLCHRAR